MEEGLPLVMDLLEDKGIRGTFLFTGRMAEEFPELAKRAVKTMNLAAMVLSMRGLTDSPEMRSDAGFLKRERFSPGLGGK